MRELLGGNELDAINKMQLFTPKIFSRKNGSQQVTLQFPITQQLIENLRPGSLRLPVLSQHSEQHFPAQAA